MLAEDAAGMAWLRRKSAMERRWGIESHVLGANELLSIAPALSEPKARSRAPRGDYATASGAAGRPRAASPSTAVTRRGAQRPPALPDA